MKNEPNFPYDDNSSVKVMFFSLLANSIVSSSKVVENYKSIKTSPNFLPISLSISHLPVSFDADWFYKFILF